MLAHSEHADDELIHSTKAQSSKLDAKIKLAIQSVENQFRGMVRPLILLRILASSETPREHAIKITAWRS